MIFLILMLSCTFKGLRVKEKGKREDISKAISEAIQNPDNENSKDILEKVNKFTAFYRNENGLLPIEEAIEFENMEAVQLLVKICEYPDKIYERIVNKKNIDLFRLIPQEKLDYMLLSRIKENEDKELEEEFLKRIEVTGLERLIVSGKIEEIKSKSKEWVIENYRDYRGTINQRRIDTAEILCIYCETDFIKEIIKILEEDIKDIKEYLLFTISKLGKKEAIKYLLDSRVDIKKKLDEDGWTALMLASQNGRKEMCELLIEKGADVNAVSIRGTALMVAAEEGNKEVCELLIEKGAEINAVNEFGTTALMFAAKEGNKEVCQLLVEKGLEVNTADKYGITAFMRAANRGNKEVCQLLIEKGADVNAVDLKNRTPLVISVESGQREIIEMLINATVQASLYNGQPCYEYSEEQISYLKEKFRSMGISLDALRTSNKLLLTDALEAGKANICKFLLSFDEVEIYLSSEDGWNVLMKVVEKKNMDVFTLLLDKVIELVAEDKDRFRSFISRVTKSSGEIFDLFVDRLLENGLNDSTRKHLGYIDLYVEPILENMFLRNYFDELSLNYLRASQVLSLDFLSVNFAKIPSLNKRGYSSIHFASMNSSNSSILRSMLCSDNFVMSIDNCRNIERISPLKLALRENLLTNAKILIAKGASPFYVKNSFWGDFVHTLRELFGRSSKALNILEENEELKSYISSQMLFDLLKEGDLENAQKRIYGPTLPIVQQEKMYRKLMKVKTSSKEVRILERYEHAYKEMLDLHVIDEEGRNVFHYLAKCVEDISMSEFLNKACDLESFRKDLLIQEDNNGQRPLHVAILNSNPYFIQYVASLNLLSEDELNLGYQNESVYDLVAKNKVSKETVDIVLKCVVKDEEVENLNQRIEENRINEKELEIVISHDWVNIFRILIDSKIELNLDNIFMDAMNFSSIDCMKYILDKIDMKEVTKKISIHDLCETGKIESLEFILDKFEVSLMDRDESGKIPLQIAVEKERVEVVNFLLEYDGQGSISANPYFTTEELEIIKKHQDSFGRSLMHSAAHAFSPHMVTLFAEMGFETRMEDKNGDRAIDYLRKTITRNSAESKARLGTMYALLCVMCGEEFDVELLNKRCIHLAVSLEEYEIIKELVREGHTNLKDCKGNTPMHLVLKNNNLDILRVLLANSSSYSPKNEDGDTPLHLAKSSKAMKMIFDAAMDVVTENELLSIRNGNGEPVLHKLVARSGKEDMEDVIKYALDSGNEEEKEIVIKGGTNNGKNAIDIARSLDKKRIEHLLITHTPDRRDRELRQSIRDRNKEKARECEEDKKDMEYILKKKKNINSKLTGSGKYAIHFAVERNDEYLIRELVKLGSRLDLEYKGENSYMLAIREGFYESLDCLLELGSVLDKNSKDKSVLEIAIEKGGKCSDICLEKLVKSRHENRIEYVARALGSLVERMNIENDYIGKAEKLLDIIADKQLKLKGNQTLLLYLIKIVEKAKNEPGKEDLSMGKGVVKKILKTRGIGELFSKDKNGESAFIKFILMDNTDYLLIMVNDLGEMSGERRDRCEEEIIKQVNENIHKLVELENVEHLQLLFTNYGKNGRMDSVIKASVTIAVKEKKERLLKRLTQFLKEINLKDGNESMYRLAIESRNMVLWKSILEIVDVLTVDKLGRSALELGVKEGGRYADVAMGKLPESRYANQPFGMKAMIRAVEITLERAEVEDRASEMTKALLNKILVSKGVGDILVKDRNGVSILSKLLLVKDVDYLSILVEVVKSTEEKREEYEEELLRQVNENVHEMIKLGNFEHLKLIFTNFKCVEVNNFYRLAIENNKLYLWRCFVKTGDVLDIDKIGESALELGIGKGGAYSGIVMENLKRTKCTNQLGIKAVIRALKIALDRSGIDEKVPKILEGLLESIVKLEGLGNLFKKDTNDSESVFSRILLMHDSWYLLKVMEVLRNRGNEDNYSQALNEVYKKIDEIFNTNTEENLLLVLKNCKEGYIVDKIKHKLLNLAVEKNNRHLLKEINKISSDGSVYRCVIEKGNHELLEELIESTDVLENKGSESILEMAVGKGGKCAGVALKALSSSKYINEKSSYILKAIKVLVEREGDIDDIGMLLGYIKDKKLEVEGKLLLIDSINSNSLLPGVLKKIIEIRGIDEVFVEDKHGMSVLWGVLLLKSKVERLRDLIVLKVDESRDYIEKFLLELKRRLRDIFENGLESTLLTFLEKYRGNELSNEIKQEALILAIEKENINTIEHLCKLGANLGEEPKQDGVNAYKLAIEREAIGSFAKLLEMGDVLDINSKNESTLEMATTKGGEFTKIAINSLQSPRCIENEKEAIAKSFKLMLEMGYEEEVIKPIINLVEILDMYGNDESILEMLLSKGNKYTGIVLKALERLMSNEDEKENIIIALKLALIRGAEETVIKFIFNYLDMLDTDDMGESVLEMILEVGDDLVDTALTALRKSTKIEENKFSIVRALKIQIEKVVKQGGNIDHVKTLFSYLKGKRLELYEDCLLIMELVKTGNLSLEILDTIIEARGVEELFIEGSEEALNKIMLMKDVNYLLKVMDKAEKHEGVLINKLVHNAEELYNKRRLTHLMLLIDKYRVPDEIRQYTLFLAVTENSEDKIERAFKLGAQVNKENKDGMNSYVLAMQEDRYVSFRKLLDLGGVLDKNSAGESVLEIALRKGEVCERIAIEKLRELENKELWLQTNNQSILNKLIDLGFDIKNVNNNGKTQMEEVKSYRDALKEEDSKLLEKLLAEGDVLEFIDTEVEVKSVLEVSVNKGGEFANVALNALFKSLYKRERALYIVKAMKIVIDRGGAEEDLLRKVEILSRNLSLEADLKLGVGRPILVELINENKLTIKLFEKIFEIIGFRELAKDYNKEALGKVLMMDTEYLLYLTKLLDNCENKESYEDYLLSIIEDNLEDLVKENKIENLKLILHRYGDKFVEDRKKEKKLGSLIYIAAKKKSRDIVELLLGNFVRFVTKRSLIADMWRKRLSEIIRSAGVDAGFPGVEFATGMIGNLVRPKEREKGLEEIMYINNIYREGKWATKIEIEGRRSLLKYFVESAKVFKEMSAEKLKARMKSKWSKGVKGVKDCIKREVGKIENCYITKKMLESRDRNDEIIDKDARREYESRMESKLGDVLKELEGYNEIRKNYKEFINGRLEKVMKGKFVWSREVGEELTVGYNGIIEAREKLRAKVEEYKIEEVRINRMAVAV